MRRRTLLKTTGATTALAATAGCLGWLPGIDGNNDTNDNGSNNTTSSNQTDRTNTTENATSGGNTSSSSPSNESDTEPDYPDAANPNTTDTTNDTEAANSSEIAANQPTNEDIEISDTGITTTQKSATVTGTLTNTGEHTISTLELRVVFVNKAGKEIGRSMWGTNDLGPGEEWDFEIVGRGEKYSTAEDYTFYPKIAS